jgi:hypothetical protein
LTHWWKAQNNFIYLNTKVEDIVDDLPLESEQNTFNINTSHLFTLTKNLSSEIVLNYFGPRIAGVSETKSIFGMNVGIQKKISDKWGTVRLSVNDIWDSLKFERNTLIPEQNLNATFGADFSNRTISLTYSRTFGNRDLRGARNRETGSEEERRRVN